MLTAIDCLLFILRFSGSWNNEWITIGTWTIETLCLMYTFCLSWFSLTLLRQRRGSTASLCQIEVGVWDLTGPLDVLMGRWGIFGSHVASLSCSGVASLPPCSAESPGSSCAFSDTTPMGRGGALPYCWGGQMLKQAAWSPLTPLGDEGLIPSCQGWKFLAFSDIPPAVVVAASLPPDESGILGTPIRFSWYR